MTGDRPTARPASPHPTAGNQRRSLWLALPTFLGATPFRHAMLFVTVVVSTGALVLWLLYTNVSEIVSRQLVETITVEADGIAELARLAGPPAAASAITQHASRGEGRLYFLEQPGGTKLAGNLDRWPTGLARTGPGGTFHYTDPRHPGTPPQLGAGTVLRLNGGLHLLVARNLDQQRQLARNVSTLFLTGFGALALAGILAGAVAGRFALRRISQMTATTDAVKAGDFSGRVPLTGSGDELDHLADNLNTMLDRIEQLMAGLREVSDNIAHDLKTPLSRLRSRAETALRDTRDLAAREALGCVIEDADDLIKTFNALLLIARLEAGAIEGASEGFDIGALAADVAELYAPVAEERGLIIERDIVHGIELAANRQLVGQAIANMLDNAIKYGKPAQSRQEPSTINVRVVRADDRAIVSVSDSGPGIPAADRQRALKRFVRLQESRTQPGTGLGLSLVAAVARLHGGSVSLEDNSPGLRIVLMLPCHR